MLNYYALNDGTIAGSPLPLTTTQGDFAFNGYTMHDLVNKVVTQVDYDDLKNIELNTFNYPKNNGGGVNSRYYRGRTITLSILLKSDTAVNFQTLIDDFKKNLQGIEGNLDIRINGSEVRRIKATCTSIDFQRKHYHVTFDPIKVTFQALEPFWYTNQDQSSSFIGKTGNFSEEMTHLGTAETYPKMYFIFGTTTASQVILSKNGVNLTITNSLTTGDILIIDSKSKSVKKNDVEIDYIGSFPVFTPGSNPFSVNFTGSVNVDITVIMPKNYL